MAAEDPGAVAAALPSSERPIRAAEVVGALSLATDLGTGQPLEHALRTAVLAVRLGELAGASAQELADTYYVALLHASGCTSNGHEAAQLYGDDIAHRAAFFLIDTTNPAEVLAFYRAHVGAGRSPEVRAAMIEDAIANAGPRARDAFATMCEVAQRFAGWLDLGSSIQAALEYVFARWDGRGFPDARGDAIPLPMRLLHVARDVSLFLSAAGPDEARAVVERRSGAAYEPRLAGLAVRNFAELLAELDETRMWEQALESEPFPQVRIAGERVDAAFMAIAALTGLKSPWLREHSTGVAELAEAAAWRMGLPADVRHPRAARRARARPRPRRRVERDLGEARAARVRGVGAGATPSALHGARLRPVADARADRAARRLAPRAARRLRLPPRHARAGARPGRPASSPPPTATAPCARRGRTGRRSTPPAAEAELMREAEEGRLDPEAVDAVLAAAGHRVPQRPRELPAGLTERELEVLLVLVRGESNQEIAEDLGISAKTVGHHVQHVYQKAGVRSRAAATRLGLRARPRSRGIGHSPDAARPSGTQTRLTIGADPRRGERQRRSAMILATTTVEDFDRFVEIFSTKGAEKRKQHGSKGSTVFRDPNEDDRVWVLFDWDAEGWQSFVSDPEVPPIMQEAGHKGRPQVAELGGHYDA